jgi:PPM family protein phosphatase
VTNGPVHVSVFGKTDLGRSRDHNEDTFLVADLSTGKASLQPDVREHELGPRGSLFMVADGMGGAAAGELASAMAADMICRHLMDHWRTDPDNSAERFAFRMREAVELANGELFTYAKEHPEVRGMGTTVTAAGVYGPDLYVTQIGDSRAYLIRDGHASQLTRDQSLTQRLVDAGELTEEEAEHSERRNIILQALGPDANVKVDLSHQPLRHGDVLVICSDGLSGLVKREEIGEMAGRHETLSALCGALIDLANERGGPDNITVVAARFDGDGLEPPDSDSEVGYRTFAMDPADVSGGVAQPVEAMPEPIAPGVVAPTGPGIRPATLVILAAGLVLLGLLLFLVL